MKKYEEPKLEVQAFEIEDIITSVPDPNNIYTPDEDA